LETPIKKVSFFWFVFTASDDRRERNAQQKNEQIWKKVNILIDRREKTENKIE